MLSGFFRLGLRAAVLFKWPILVTAPGIPFLVVNIYSFLRRCFSIKIFYLFTQVDALPLFLKKPDTMESEILFFYILLAGNSNLSKTACLLPASSSQSISYIQGKPFPGLIRTPRGDLLAGFNTSFWMSNKVFKELENLQHSYIGPSPKQQLNRCCTVAGLWLAILLELHACNIGAPQNWTQSWL